MFVLVTLPTLSYLQTPTNPRGFIKFAELYLLKTAFYCQGVMMLQQSLTNKQKQNDHTPILPVYGDGCNPKQTFLLVWPNPFSHCFKISPFKFSRQ